MSNARGSRASGQWAPPDIGVDLAPKGLGYLLGVAHRAHRRSWDAQISDLHVTAPQAALLRLISAQPGRGVRQLARELRTDPMNVQRLAESLIGSGLCEVRADPHDARRRPLYPTGSGASLARELSRRAEQVEQRLARALGAERYRLVITSLSELIDQTPDPQG